MKITILFAGMAALFLVAGCDKTGSTGPKSATPDSNAQLPERFKNEDPVPKPNFTKAAEVPAFQQAIKDVTALLGAKPQPLRSPGDDELIGGGVSFDVPPEKLEPILRKAHTDFLARGFYLFRYEQNFGIGGEPDKVGLLPTRDKYEVMAAMETNGDNYGIGTAGVIAWMKELEQEQPFVLTGIGFDFMEGFFTTSVKDPAGLAKRMYQFCPDIVEQGVGSVDALAQDLRDRDIFFWWD